MKEGSSSRPSERNKWRVRIPAPSTAVMSAGIEKIKFEDKIASKIRTATKAIIQLHLPSLGEIYLSHSKVLQVQQLVFHVEL